MRDNNPATFQANWNRSYELKPAVVRGGVLLLHGMSDSPYSLRRIGEIYQRNGFYVLGLRHPGHGTVPAGLLDLKWEGMLEAVNLAVAHLRDVAGGKGPFHIVGYSTGAALAIKLDVPLYAGYSTRIGDGIRYRCWTERVATDGDPETITRKLNELLEQYVRAAPEQWWWFHKRFKPRGEYHLFAGDGMVHAFHIKDGKVDYRNRWVRTPAFEAERARLGSGAPPRHRCP